MAAMRQLLLVVCLGSQVGERSPLALAEARYFGSLVSVQTRVSQRASPGPR